MKNLFKRFPIYGNRTVKIAFEFGLVLSEVAKKEKINLTMETSTRAENILIQELRTKGFKKTSLNFIPLILAALELK
jgi:hypothetical protein